MLFEKKPKNEPKTLDFVETIFYAVNIDEFAFCDHFAVEILKEGVFRKTMQFKSYRSDSKVRSLSQVLFVKNSGSRDIA